MTPASGSERIDFDEPTHSYSVNGKSLTSVTKVIESVLRIDSPHWRPHHRLRGTMVHAIIQAINDGDWDADSTVVPEGFDRNEIIQRGHGYEKFMGQTGFQPLYTELRVADTELGIAGTLDVHGVITRGAYMGRRAILDAKSGIPTAAAILQLALYEHCLQRTNYSDLRVILELRKDGSIRPQFREGAADIMDALALVRLWKFKNRNGIT